MNRPVFLPNEDHIKFYTDKEKDDWSKTDIYYN